MAFVQNLFICKNKYFVVQFIKVIELVVTETILITTIYLIAERIANEVIVSNSFKMHLLK